MMLRAMRLRGALCLSAIGLALVGYHGCGAPTGGTNTNSNSATNSNENGSSTTCAPGTGGGATTVSYANDIAPIFEGANCTTAGCHGDPPGQTSYSQLSYESYFVPAEGATSLGVCPIVPGDPDASFLITKLNPNPPVGVQMPQTGAKLTQDQIDLIRQWILEGAQNN